MTSYGDGMIGISIRSMALRAWSMLKESAPGMSQMIRSYLSFPWTPFSAAMPSSDIDALTVGTLVLSGLWFCRSWRCLRAVTWGSKSHNKVRTPSAFARSAILNAKVVLPVPPFQEANAMVVMAAPVVAD